MLVSVGSPVAVGPAIPIETDLRTDACTLPTDEMWQAMRRASEVAPSVAASIVDGLEAAAAHLTGMESCVFTPTGTVANLAALMTHTRRGDQIIVDEASHIVWSEELAFASVCGLSSRAVALVDGAPELADVRAALTEERMGHRPTTSLLVIETPQAASGGMAIGAERIADLCSLAHAFGAAVHIDGARIFNAAIALGCSVQELVSPADSLMLSLNKGLSSPIGALLCGSEQFIEAVRINLKRLGAASLHQAGLWAAAGIEALRISKRLADDHRRACALAVRLAELDRVEVEFASTQTNVVIATLAPGAPPAAEVCELLARRGVGARAYDARRLRFVTHRHVDDRAIEHVAEAVKAVMSD
jgi:threonine aldolase